MQLLLFTGKGGVGKTTLAAASAVRIAAEGTKVLACSTDPAHSLADALDHPLGDEPAEVGHGLFGMQLDARALVATRWPAIRGVLGALGDPAAASSGPGFTTLAAEEITVLPGVEELIGLAEVRRLAGTGPWDVVVLDCGPTAETLRMLALPEAVNAYLRRLWPRHRRAVSAALDRSGGSFAGAAAAIGRLEDEAGAVHALLTDRAHTTARLVLTPERVVLAETRRTLTALALHGLSVDRVVVNQVLPRPREQGPCDDPAWTWLRARSAEQHQVLGSLDALLAPGPPATRVAHRAQEPVGSGGLAELAADLYREHPVLGGDGPEPRAGDRVELESGTGTDSVYRWRLVLPLVEEAEVAVDRVDDDLLVTVGSVRRRRRLPPVLRRCDVLDARVGPGELLVRFRPDPDLWPR